MKLKAFGWLLGFCLALAAAVPQAAAAYNPAKDNPYVKPAAGNSKKWYAPFKKETLPAYTQKPYGYWTSTEEENILVRGVKAFGNSVKEIIAAALK